MSDNKEHLARESLERFRRHHVVDDLVVSSQQFGKLQHGNGAPFGEIYSCQSPEWQNTAYGLVGCVKGLDWALSEIDRLRALLNAGRG